jgi:hypothetical protein
MSKVVPKHTMKAYRGMKAQVHSFLTSALDASEWCCHAHP